MGVDERFLHFEIDTADPRICISIPHVEIYGIYLVKEELLFPSDANVLF